MVQVGRRSLFRDQTQQNYVQLFVGIIVGCIITTLYLGGSATEVVVNPTTPIDASSSSNLRALQNKNKNTGQDEADGGWHPINVFYGEKSGLKAPEGQEWFAQVHQDEIVMDLIGPNGYFIDLAANDALELTNTLALERHGWNGLCIEPNPGYWYGLSHRKCTVVGALVGGTKQKVEVKFRGVYGGIVGKLDDKLANRKGEPKAPKEERYTAPIQDVLTRFHVPPTIDYMSLDVEGAELLIMKEFPFDKYTIKLMTVERPDDDLRKLLQSKGYIFLKDLAWWGETLWAHTSTGLTPSHPKIQKIQTEERN